ncbi:hypothetical protein PT105_05340 [Erysipelothrix rhusiopathiae]|uniref:hypothetical protein n=1 Tax=Erysipelothrix rhusiopathiae TaxID=1648 RepID=UPI000F434734|nr:hypothetical protein [Erysipelothrix rhusiopathiae]AYV34784.1 hypothetical protein EEY85_05530 [Erysipelothrix rhusiopathiae]MDE8082059.1 hypothetical protein [Erysipelothrix rhusiopathiae]MDE8314167.1 hypothetical protein [Erysipelothrix rhusiopathiae]MDE8329512.1 hypothetical protein [Erysipelothrix rhusiopathiae]MDE8332853.1 hypothetical protein [Erysipelothrix rhusiopathiae]
MKKSKVILALTSVGLISSVLVSPFIAHANAQFDSGYVKTGSSVAGRYGTYRGSKGTNSGTTSASWYNGGGGTVYVYVSGKEYKKSGTQLTGPTSITGFGPVLEGHKYFGGPAV